METLSETDLNKFAETANKAADAARQVIRKHYSNGTRFEYREKEEGEGPVTNADVETEQAMVAIIQEAYPQHSIYGEETGWHNKPWSSDAQSMPLTQGPGHKPDNAKDKFIWVLDPIDGTSSFVAKSNCAFGTLIALVYNGKPILGIIDQPILSFRWVGVKGEGTTFNGKKVNVKDCCDELSEAKVHLKAPNCNDDSQEVYDCLEKKVGKRMFNGNCIVFGELVLGFVDVVVDCGLDPFDFLALVPVVEGAGGVVTDWEGNELIWNAGTKTPEFGFKIVAAAGTTIHGHVIDSLSHKSQKLV